jgi:uncharacterized coiled-coil protein SlyX
MAAVEERVAYVEGRVSELSNTLVALRGDFARVEQRMDARFDAVDERMSRQFHWLVGILITTLVAMLGTMLSMLTRN